MYDNRLQEWEDSLATLVTVVKNGREVLVSLKELLDGDIDAIESGIQKSLDEQTLRRLFIKIRDSVDSKVETLNRALNQIAQMT